MAEATEPNRAEVLGAAPRSAGRAELAGVAKSVAQCCDELAAVAASVGAVRPALDFSGRARAGRNSP